MANYLNREWESIQREKEGRRKGTTKWHTRDHQVRAHHQQGSTQQTRSPKRADRLISQRTNQGGADRREGRGQKEGIGSNSRKKERQTNEVNADGEEGKEALMGGHASTEGRESKTESNTIDMANK